MPTIQLISVERDKWYRTPPPLTPPNDGDQSCVTKHNRILELPDEQIACLMCRAIVDAIGKLPYQRLDIGPTQARRNDKLVAENSPDFLDDIGRGATHKG